MTTDPPWLRFITPELPDLELLHEDLRAIYASRMFSNGGPFDQRLAYRAAAYVGAAACVPVANATLGLMLAIGAVARGREGRLAVMPSFTFPATALAAEWVGLTPVLCDIDEHSWQPRLPESYLNRHASEIALVVLCNTFGAPADVDAWSRAARHAGVPLLVDSASGFGGTYSDGRFFGAAGHVEVFSMNATKTLAVSEGGLITTDDVELAERLRQARNFGMAADRVCRDLGLNAKLSEIHAAIACRVLDQYDGILAHRRHAAALYRSRLETRGYRFQRHGERSPYQAVPVRLPESVARASLRSRLQRAGIETAEYFSTPLHCHPRYASAPRAASLAVTERVASDIVCLPMNNRLTEADVDRVCAALLENGG